MNSRNSTARAFGRQSAEKRLVRRMPGRRACRHCGRQGSTRGLRTRGGGQSAAEGSAEEVSAQDTQEASPSEPAPTSSREASLPVANPPVSSQNPGDPALRGPSSSLPGSSTGVQSGSGGHQLTGESCVPAIPGGPLSSTLAEEDKADEVDVEATDADEAFLMSEESALVIDEEAGSGESRASSPSKRARVSASPPQPGTSKEVASCFPFLLLS